MQSSHTSLRPKKIIAQPEVGKKSFAQKNCPPPQQKYNGPSLTVILYQVEPLK